MKYVKTSVRLILFGVLFFTLSVVGAQEPPTNEGDQAGDKVSAGAQAEEELVYLNVQEADIKDVIKQISKATGKNFIIDDKVRGKVTIISERPMTREEAYQTFLSSLGVAGFTIVKGPAGVIKIIPLRDAVKEPIPTHVDTTPITDMFITRLIPLQNISAVDMSNAIKGLVSKNGNLFAYPATNTLIITDSGTNIDRLMKIIKELDQEGPQQVLEIIPVHNASAREVGQMVNDLFEQEKAAGGARARKRGAEPEEIEEVSKIIPDERTNSIIVLASKRAIEKVRSIIGRLDMKVEGGEGKIHVYYLKHAKAKDMSETLSTLTSGSTAGTKGKDKGSAVAEFEGGMKVTADEATNSLIITATSKDFQILKERVISKLDVARRQVYLEAVIMELSITKDNSLGVKGFGGGQKGAFSFFGADPYSNLLGGFLGGSPNLPAGILGGMIGRDTIPITVGDTTRNIPSMGLFFSALSTYGDSNIISTPNILTMDNEEAKIEVTQKQYYQGNTTFNAAGLAQVSTDSAEAGLLLKITPQIGEGDNIMMKIEQSLSGFGVQINANLPPPTKERSINTSVVTKDGQTVVLGGLMEDRSTNGKEKIPLLGDIPILGNLFKHSTIHKEKVNLLVFITPHIVKDASDFTAILKRKIEQRNQFLDDNYGRKQRKEIRKAISGHREDLLEFTGGPMSIKAPEAMVYPSNPTSMERQPVVTTPQSYEVKDRREVPRVKAPTVAVPPPAPGSRPDELDLEY